MTRRIYVRPTKKAPFVRQSALLVIEDPCVEEKLRDLARHCREPLLVALKTAVKDRLLLVDHRLAGVPPWRWRFYRPHP